MWIYIVIGLLGFGVVALGIGLVVNLTRNKKTVAELRDKVEREKIRQQETERVQKMLCEQQDKTNESYENRLLDWDRLIAEKQDVYDKKSKEIKEVEKKIEEIEKDNSDKRKKLEEELAGERKKLEEELSRKREELSSVNEQRLNVVKAQNEIEKSVDAAKKRQDELEEEVAALEKEIEELKEKKRLAILHQDENVVEGWEFFITPHEKELISLLEKIKTDYAELRGDIATIEWKKIWLPKIQDIVNRNELDGKKCIYRLVLKEDNEVCYVGQAANVKERWYQHIKKMVGVDAIGNEKLYEYRPDDFLWTIVEENPKNLNESEHYWIEYFGCTEKGLNKKK